MEHTARTKALSWLLSLALVLSLVPGLSLTAYATGTEWSESFTTNGGTIDGGVTVSGNITLTIPENVTLTVNGGINANGHTLTVDGAGTLNVTGANGGNGSNSSDLFEGNGGNGGNGSAGFTGTLVVDGTVVNVTGGNGGNGGSGGEFEGNGGNGGIGGYGVSGDVTVRSGSATVTGGNGGNGGSGGKADGNRGSTGNPGRAVEGAITGNARESENNSTWSDVTNGTSTKQYVEVLPAHNHSFTYSASGATITATCANTDQKCPLPDDGNGNHTATLTIKPPANLVYDGKAKAATVEGEIPDVTTPDIMYEGRNGTTYVESTAAPTEKGDYTASVTLGEKTAGVDFTIKDASYTIIIPAKLTVENAGWNATAGVTASGEIAEGTKLTVTAESANNWALKSGDNAVGYYLTTAEGGAKTTAWSFTAEELAAENGTTKAMGAVVEEYINKPAGDYADTVTFTASVEAANVSLSDFKENGAVLQVAFKQTDNKPLSVTLKNDSGTVSCTEYKFNGYNGSMSQLTVSLSGDKLTISKTGSTGTAQLEFDLNNSTYSMVQMVSEVTAVSVNGIDITSKLSAAN